MSDSLETAAIGTHSIDADGIVLRANQAELALLGYAREEFVGHHIAEFHVDAEASADLFRRLRAGETVHDHAVRMRCGDGSIKDVLISASPEVEDGRLVGAHCFTHDVTGSRRTERRLATQDAVTRALAESDTLGEAAPRILEAVCELLGWEVGGLWFVDRRANVLRCGEVWHRPSVYVPEFEATSRRYTFAPGIGLPGRVWVSGEATCIPDVVSDPNFPRAPIARREGLHGALGFPIVLAGEVLGVIEFFSREIRQPDEDLLQMMRGIGSQIGQFLERKRAEEALRASEQRFARFMQHLPGLAWIKDLEGRYVYANDAAVKVFGTPREALYGRTDDEVFPPHTAAQFKENDRAALASGTGIQVIETLEHEDGLLHDSLVSKFPIMNLEGRPVLVGGMAIDVTDRVRAEEALRRSQERLDLAQRAGRIGTYEWIVPTGEVTWTEAEEALYGLAPGGFGGRYEHWKQAVHPDDRERAEAEVLRAVADRTDLDTEFRVVWPDGTIRWIAAKGKVFSSATGEPLRMLGVNLDVTERKRAEEALREADRRKDEFLATLAHELRNPLAPIRDGLEILRVARDHAASARVLGMLQRQVDHLVRLVDDLLEVSRITRGRIELRRERVELGAVVGSAIETSRPLIETRGHALTVSLPAEPLVLDADPIRLAQVLANLLNNAAKYTDSGGRIDLVAERHCEEVVIRVGDNGIGIPPDMLARVFDMFAQVDESLARSQGGLGIGLTLARSIVELHGGSVAASSGGPGKGSEFTLRLPLASTLVPERGATAAGEDRGTTVHRILVVDDNRDAAESLGVLLKLMGSEVQVAHDGVSALAAMRTYQPSVVLLDVGMPGMDGYEVARRVRSEQPRQPALLIALTGWGQEEDRRRAREAGFDHHLVKPVDLDVLQELLAASK